MPKKSQALDDSAIVKLVTAGDKEKFALLIERYESKLLRYAQFLVNDYDSALDIVQESFIKAYINLNSFNKSKSFSPWIYRITHNQAINAIKKNKKTISFSSLDKNEDSFQFDYKLDEQIDKIFLQKEVLSCVKKLSFKYREVITLFYFEHLSYEQISEILHIPKSTVGVRISRAKSMLKKLCNNVRGR